MALVYLRGATFLARQRQPGNADAFSPVELHVANDMSRCTVREQFHNSRAAYCLCLRFRITDFLTCLRFPSTEFLTPRAKHGIAFRIPLTRFASSPRSLEIFSTCSKGDVQNSCVDALAALLTWVACSAICSTERAVRQKHFARPSRWFGSARKTSSNRMKRKRSPCYHLIPKANIGILTSWCEKECQTSRWVRSSA